MWQHEHLGRGKWQRRRVREDSVGGAAEPGRVGGGDLPVNGSVKMPPKGGGRTEENKTLLRAETLGLRRYWMAQDVVICRTSEGRKRRWVAVPSQSRYKTQDSWHFLLSALAPPPPNLFTTSSRSRFALENNFLFISVLSRLLFRGSFRPGLFRAF